MRSGFQGNLKTLCSLFLAGSALFAGLGCSSMPGRSAGTGERVLPLTVRRGSADLPAGDRVLRDKAEFEEVWAAAKIKSPPPEIDFSQEMVLLSARGCLPNACYRTRFVSFTVEGNGGWAWVEDEDPAPSCFCALTLTCPFHMVKVPRLDGPVEFEHRMVRKDCVERRRP